MTAPPIPTVVIEPARGWVPLRLDELWQYRELSVFLTTRQLKVRYKQTVLGAAWALVGPLFNMVLFTIFFGKVANLESKLPAGLPYPLWSFAALVPWALTAGAMNQASVSLVTNANMVKKVYFPRFVLPISSVLSALIDFSIAFTMLLILMVAYGVMPGWQVVTLPLFVVMACATALGGGLWFSALNVQFRDVKFILGFFTQAMMWITPIAWPITLLDGYSGSLTQYISAETLKMLFFLNPATAIVEGFRWALLGTQTAPAWYFLISASITVTVLITGAYFFRRMEKTFADVV